ncbi:hypothetical protein QQP08_018524 [Theobroma cacao]|nr:hypothetical protein QQP08_018524 [Theobroma cacao]
MFPISGCSHSFCSDCISMHVRTKLEGNITIIMCPGDCRVILELEACRPLLPKEVVNLWEDLLCEELLCATGGRLYCPFKDCSALLLNDNQGEVIAECFLSDLQAYWALSTLVVADVSSNFVMRVEQNGLRTMVAVRTTKRPNKA